MSSFESVVCFEKYSLSGCVTRTSRPSIESSSAASCLLTKNSLTYFLSSVVFLHVEHGPPAVEPCLVDLTHGCGRILAFGFVYHELLLLISTRASDQPRAD